MAEELTDKLIKDLPKPASGNRITYDEAVRGLGVRVTSAGARAWIFNYRAGRTERRMTIGDTAAWPVKKARERAKELRRLVDDGKDPMAERHAGREAPTVNDLADKFVAEHVSKKRPSTQDEYGRLLRVHIRPALGRKRVADLQYADLEAMHRKIAATAPYAANRALAVMSKMLNLSIRWQMRTDNPAKGVERSQEEKRERFLVDSEIARLSEALAAHPERMSANAVRFLLLTGARKGETLSASWRQIDLSAGVWTKPSAATKQAKEHRIPLSAPALLLLSEMKRDADKENERRAKEKLPPITALFPGTDGKPLTDIKHFWASICRTAGLAVQVEKKNAQGRAVRDETGAPVMVWQSTVRIHDLRHTHASILVNLGLSLPIIGKLLGHTQAATTHRYAHLQDDPLRAATERAGVVITAAGKPSAEVVDLAERRA
jgi:integrase